MMKLIEGNTPFTIQTSTSETTNAIGEKETVWNNAYSFSGILGMQSSDSKYTSFNTKGEESTHTMICDFNSDIYALKEKNTRVIANGRMYDVLYIDNPDELDMQLEIYLRYVGVQNVG